MFRIHFSGYPHASLVLWPYEITLVKQEYKHIFWCDIHERDEIIFITRTIIWIRWRYLWHAITKTNENFVSSGWVLSKTITRPMHVYIMPFLLFRSLGLRQLTQSTLLIITIFVIARFHEVGQCLGQSMVWSISWSKSCWSDSLKLSKLPWPIRVTCSIITPPAMTLCMLSD